MLGKFILTGYSGIELYHRHSKVDYYKSYLLSKNSISLSVSF
jgi:hypothetical protein